MTRRLLISTLLLSAGALLLGVGYMTGLLTTAKVSAQSQTEAAFSLQVSPSPLIATVKPGVSETLELRVRNTGTAAQDLKMELRAFTVNDASGEIDLQDTAPTDVAGFVRFEKPNFSLGPGEIATQRVVIDTPASAGFTYSFAIIISQQRPPQTVEGVTNLRGTVAVFTLLNVDKPGASRKLELGTLSVSKRIYEFLPAELAFTVKNTGNTLVQPKGTLYIQRNSDDTKPIAAIPLNESGGFILPGTKRTLQASWQDGYPHYETVAENGQSSVRKLVWQGSDISELRMGRYVAKLVAVYDDGRRDIPLTAEVTFWVIPWRILAVATVILLLIVVGIITTLRHSGKALGFKKLKSSGWRRDSRYDRLP